MEYQILLGFISVVVGLMGFIPYFWDIVRKRTKPHAFSWLIWGMIMTITFFASISKGGGAGAWVEGGSGVACLTIFVVSLSRGEKEIALLDKLSLLAAMFGIALWLITSNPLNAVVIVSLVDAAGFVPTFRKTYKKPGEETLSMYTLNGLGIAISLFALQAVNLTTVLYPASVVLSNSLFITMVMVRRAKLRKYVKRS